MNIIAKCLAVAGITLLASCSITPYPEQVKVDDRSEYLYLRGNFTWWDIEQHAKVERVEGQVYKAKVELIADGQPYEFKFADENWSLGANCGYYNKADQQVVIGKKSSANCNAKFEPFKFTPSVTADYNFYIDFSELELPKVWIEQAPEENLIQQLVPNF